MSDQLKIKTAIADFKKQGLTPNKVFHVVPELDADFVGFIVEALLNQRWKRVGGPFDSKQRAIKFAKDYATDNNCETKVVGFA